MSSIKKTVLITGSNRGIGLTFTEHYLKEGWKVIAAARNPDNADKLRALKPDQIVQLDVADEASILAAAKTLEGQPIDLLLNNAGILDYRTLDTTAKSDMMHQYEVNTVGPFLVSRAFQPHLKEAVAAHGSATLANMSSWLGCITEINKGENYGYRASKAALNIVTAALAHDFKADSIAVVALHPGIVLTELTNFNGFLKPEESVAGLTKVVAGVTMEDTGKFIAFDSRVLPW